MTASRLNFIVFASALLFVCSFGTANAGFFGGGDTGKSGLDLNSGYDRNTVRTFTGNALASPHQADGNHMMVEVKDGSETVNLLLGPANYWQTNGIPVNSGDELSVKGSAAQGRDGKSYVMVQKLANKTAGAEVELRTETGTPGWSGGRMNSGRSWRDGGMRHQGGGMNRGGRGMMR